MDTTVESLIDYYGQVIAGRGGPELSMACAEHLERALLDYGIDSLHAIDRYLLVVHEAQEDIPTIAYANTILATAIYVGEAIRRSSPSTVYRWGRTQQTEVDNSSTAVVLSDLSGLVLLSSTSGTPISPTKCVLRRIRRGAQAYSVHAFAVAAIQCA